MNHTLLAYIVVIAFLLVRTFMPDFKLVKTNNRNVVNIDNYKQEAARGKAAHR